METKVKVKEKAKDINGAGSLSTGEPFLMQKNSNNKQRSTLYNCGLPLLSIRIGGYANAA